MVYFKTASQASLCIPAGLDVWALGLNHWIDPSVESMGEFYWGDENADDAGLPDLWFP